MSLKYWIVLIAALHVIFLILETFFWQFTSGRLAKRFPNEAPGVGTKDREMLRVLFWNQGIYNGFLAAGLFWSVLRWEDASTPTGPQLAIFFLSCVAIAGIFGFLTAYRAPIFLVQALPASAALAVLLLGSRHVAG